MKILILFVSILALSACNGAGATPKLKVGLVTDTGGVNDHSFNQAAWAGVQKAITDFVIDGRYIESNQSTDYEKNIDQFANENFDVIITVGMYMSDATAAKARQYPDIKFAIVDNAYLPTKNSEACPEIVENCFADGGLTNVTSLMFQEDQLGFLAGVVAGGMTRTGTVCTVAGLEIDPVVKYVIGYQNGARWINPDVKALNVYLPSFVDPTKGQEAVLGMINQGCDVVFGVDGKTGNGSLLAAEENNLMAIGVDVDQYLTFPEVRDVLITSAMKKIDVAVYEYIKTVVNKTDKAGLITAGMQNTGVGLAPYHDWDSKVPQWIKDKVKEATNGLKNGSLNPGHIER